MTQEEIRKLCGKIPLKPCKNPYQQKTTPIDMFLHADDVNFYDKKIFPFPKYDIVVFVGEPNPPCFYVYCENTAIAVSMETGKIIAVKKKGRNPKVVKYVAKNITKWLNKNSTYEDDRTNWEVIKHAWNTAGYLFYDGKIITTKEYFNKKEVKEFYDKFESTDKRDS